MGKTNPLNDADLAGFVELQASFAVTPKSWSVERSAIDPASFDLSVKNPDAGEQVAVRSPEAILAEIAALDAQSNGILAEIRALL